MQNKKQIILSILAIFVLSVLVIGATLAYFQAQGDTTKSVSTIVKTYTTDVFSFETGSALTISLDQESFASGKGNATGTTFAKAILTANNKTNSATEYYYLYLNILENTFNYTQDENTPEILLSITDKDGTAFTSISSLNYKTVTDASGKKISGYDITNTGGLIALFDNKKITTTSSIEDTWNVTATFINYDADQSANAGKSFEAKLMIQKDKITTLSDYVIAQYTGTQGVNGLYYHNSSLSNGAGDNSYRYAGGDYIVTTQAAMAGLNFVTSSASDGVVNMYCGGTRKDIGSECQETKYYTLSYDTTNTQYSTYSAALEKAVTDGYLAKDYIKNFVCFGSDAENCPTDNLYRIIGVIGGKVKLVKYDYATSALLGTNGDYMSTDPIDYFTGYTGNLTSYSNFTWNDSDEKNVWSESSLNNINLNTNFINNIGSDWASKIATTTWQVAGNTWEKIGSVLPSTAYENEVKNPSSSTTYKAKIGLMYASDYGFAAHSANWNTIMSGYNRPRLASNNWMYMGICDWTISRISDTSSDALSIYITGEVMSNDTMNGFGIRPCFYLNTTVSYVSGDGSMSDPIRIK